MKINEKLISLRKEKGWSQEEVANKLDISRQSVSKWELGECIPDTTNIMKLSNIYDIEVGELLGENAKQERVKKNKILRLILLLIAVIIVCYLGLAIYKYIIINNINIKFNEYENLSNYKIKLEDYDFDNENIIKETKSITYCKDGIEKKVYIKDGKTNAIFYINYNSNEAIITNENNKTISKLDMSTINEEKGKGISMLNPSVIYCNNNITQQIVLALSLNLKIENNESEYIIKYKGQTIWIDKESALPSKSIYREDNKEHRRIFNFTIGQTTDEEIKEIDKDKYLIK